MCGTLIKYHIGNKRSNPNNSLKAKIELYSLPTTYMLPTGDSIRIKRGKVLSVPI